MTHRAASRSSRIVLFDLLAVDPEREDILPSCSGSILIASKTGFLKACIVMLARTPTMRGGHRKG